MRLPRRVPWAYPSELDQLCAWIYTDEHDTGAKSLAIDRLSAWKATTPLPHALESTLSLLAVSQQDTNTNGSLLNSVFLRQSYAAAIIRLVNGLVDPLQLGLYARSIASIAAQLHLPQWLVELRHAATHEDLPSLEVLREAVRESMLWLLHNYFLPTIDLTSTSIQGAPLRPLEPILKEYKSILKIITRDASLRSRYKQEVNAITRDIERWIAEAKVTANIIVGEVGWDASGPHNGETVGITSSQDVDPKERWALEQLCDALLEKGGLVSLSKKKRVFPEDKFWPPDLSVALWAPLLMHIHILHAEFPTILCTRILSLLLEDTTISNREASGTESIIDSSYNNCLARWVMWALATWSPVHGSQGGNTTLKNHVLSILVKGLGRVLGDTHFRDTKAAKTLLQALCSENPSFLHVAEFLSTPSDRFSLQEWADHDTEIMTGRLAQLRSSVTSQNSDIASTPNPDAPYHGKRASVAEADLDNRLPVGWRRVDDTRWKPCPIGVFQRV